MNCPSYSSPIFFSSLEGGQSPEEREPGIKRVLELNLSGISWQITTTTTTIITMIITIIILFIIPLIVNEIVDSRISNIFKRILNIL